MQEQKIILRLIKNPLPRSIHGLSAKDGDAIIVLINEDDDPDTQQEAFIHEMLHVWHGDHDRENIDVNKLEAQRHTETRREVQRQGIKGVKKSAARRKKQTANPQVISPPAHFRKFLILQILNS